MLTSHMPFICSKRCKTDLWSTKYRLTQHQKQLLCQSVARNARVEGNLLGEAFALQYLPDWSEKVTQTLMDSTKSMTRSFGSMHPLLAELLLIRARVHGQAGQFDQVGRNALPMQGQFGLIHTQTTRKEVERKRGGSCKFETLKINYFHRMPMPIPVYCTFLSFKRVNVESSQVSARAVNLVGVCCA